MQIDTITLTNFRSFGPAGHRLTLAPGNTTLVGANGSGKALSDLAKFSSRATERTWGLCSVEHIVERFDLVCKLRIAHSRRGCQYPTREGVMKRRRAIAFLAIIGVLFHAAAVVRHGVMMLSLTAAPAAHSLAADLTVICHGAVEAAEDGKGTTGAPGTVAKHCPLCTTVAAAASLAVPEIFELAAPALAATHQFIRVDIRSEQLKRIRPPGRGPPFDL